MVAYVLVAIGGALGSVARFWISGLVAARYGQSFPWNTLVINITGSLLIGFLAALTDTEGRWLASPGFRQFFMVGVCGGYTTFSSFSLQTLNLLRDREWLYAGANVLFSVLLCMVAVAVGFFGGESLDSWKGR
jgi:CrcB protein